MELIVKTKHLMHLKTVGIKAAIVHVNDLIENVVKLKKFSNSSTTRRIFVR